MRGALFRFQKGARRLGIIPAYAGSTHPAIFARNGEGDHPRVCGEHRARRSAAPTNMGSSPRMRGAPRFLGVGCGLSGIIPAYAGSTTWSSSGAARARDHPRVCGEHLEVRLAGSAREGSSPRMRGAPVGSQRGIPQWGIIPAYAGSTARRPSARPQGWDHPRVCGEHLVTSTVLST